MISLNTTSHSSHSETSELNYIKTDFKTQFSIQGKIG
jgi:hypothetical protein